MTVEKPVEFDSWGPLDRPPPRPKRAILVQLRRALVTAERWVKQVAEWRKRVTGVEARLEAAVAAGEKRSAQNILLRARRHDMRTLNRLEQRRNLVLRRLACLVDAARERSLKNKTALRRVGAAEMRALIDRAQTVVDVVIVRDRLPGQNEAFSRLSEVVRRLTAGLIHSAVKTGLIPEQDAKARADEATLQAAEQWSWNRGVGQGQQKFSSYAYTKTMRNLQFRTKADRPILSKQRQDGSWSQAGSLDGLATEDGTREITPFAVNHHETFTSPVAASRAGAHHAAITADVANALASLPEQDRQIADLLLVQGLTVKETAAAVQISDIKVKARRAAILEALRDRLAAYQEGGDL